MLYRLIYTSKAAAETGDAELRSIAMHSALRNRQLNVMGLLLYHAGNIMQVLEGDEGSVKALYDKIHQDKRHTDVVLISGTSVDKAEFTNWSMGYRALDSDKDMQAIFDLTRESLRNALPREASKDIKIATSKFADDTAL